MKTQSKFWKLFQKFPSEVFGIVFQIAASLPLFDQHSLLQKHQLLRQAYPKGSTWAKLLRGSVIVQCNFTKIFGCSAVFPDLGNLNPKHLKKLNSLGIFTDNICDIQSIQHSNQTPNNRFSLSIWSISILHSLHQALYRVPQHRRQSPWISSPTSGWKVWDFDLGSIFMI